MKIRYTFLLLVAISISGCTKKEVKPNLVFLIPDQYRRAAVGFMNEDPVITPNIDQLASEGLVFTDATSTVPVCSPYRGMLMTGNFYTINNLPRNCNSNSPGVYLRTEDHTLLDALDDHNYNVAYIGKWHLEEPFEPYVPSGNNKGPGKMNWEEWTPPERRHGVDFWYAYNTWDNHFKPHYWTNASTRDQREEISAWSAEHETSIALDFIKNAQGDLRDPDQPFAVFLSYNPPHTGYTFVPDEYKALYNDFSFDELNTRESVVPNSGGARHAMKSLANYFACVSGIDAQVGRIVELLKGQGLYENTIIVFTSDHGNCVGAHNHITKSNFYEESFGVPLIISWPAKIRHRTTELLFTPTDFFPTLASLLGLEAPDVQGKDLSEQLVSNKGDQHDGALYVYMCHSNVDSLIEGHPGKAWGERGFRTKNHMLVVNKRPGQITEYHLTDLKADPFQMKNIASNNEVMVESILKDQLNPKLKEIGDEWHLIPISEASAYPPNFRSRADDADIWDWEW